jgi:hypothetical protein
LIPSFSGLKFEIKYRLILGTHHFSERLRMQEILTAVTYLVVWLICERVIGIESGLTKLIVSLGAAVGVYTLIAVKEYRDHRVDKDR